MPELPEVETIVRGLRPGLVGAEIEGVWWSGLPLRLGRALEQKALGAACGGAVVKAIERRGKYIVIGLRTACADEEAAVVVHLGMSGRLRLVRRELPREPHTHVVWSLHGGRELRFVDPRRFGCVLVADRAEQLPELAALGPDPLAELTPALLAAALARSRMPLKGFLLDQRRIAGLGNIYVCEALLRAGLHPGTPASAARGKASKLFAAIQEVLELGISNRGTTLRDYVDAEGGAGGNQAALLVYGREGKPCPRCGTKVRRQTDGGRSTFFCPSCQPRTAGRGSAGGRPEPRRATKRSKTSLPSRRSPASR